MTDTGKPFYRTGKICYLELPADDVDQAAEFYRTCFGWSIRRDGADDIAFDDTVGGVSGMWVTGRPPMSEPGPVVSIMVADADATVAGIVMAGGQIVRPIDPALSERFAWFRDPAGNVLGIYEQPGLAESEQSAPG